MKKKKEKEGESRREKKKNKMNELAIKRISRFPSQIIYLAYRD